MGGRGLKALGTAFLDVICPRSAERGELVLKEKTSVHPVFAFRWECSLCRAPGRFVTAEGLSAVRPLSPDVPAHRNAISTHKGKSHVANCKVLDLSRLRAATGSGKGWEPLKRTMRSRNVPRARENSIPRPAWAKRSSYPWLVIICIFLEVYM